MRSMTITIISLVAVATSCSGQEPAGLLTTAGVCQGEIESKGEGGDLVSCDTGNGGYIIVQSSEALDAHVAMKLDQGQVPFVVGDGWIVTGNDDAALLTAAERLDGEMIRDVCDGQLWLDTPPTAC